jgi:hypothetical protein
MNLERILAENLLRFGGKNLNKQLFVYKYLLEQSDKQAAAIELLKAQGEAYEIFQNWQREVNQEYGNIILTKTLEYVPINQEPITIDDKFYNNFVTLETGVKDPEAIKAKLDNMIETLKQQGANMTNPKTVIEILSTASPSPASTKPNPDDFPSGTVPKTHTKIDHTYGGQLTYDKVGKPTPESIAWAKTNGNEFLAKQRGESVKKYLQEKGVEATITVVALTGQPERVFKITAKQEGTRKVITPIGVPDIQWECGFSAQLKIAWDIDFSEMIRTQKNHIEAMYQEVRTNQQGAYLGTGFKMAEPDPAKFPDKNSKEYQVEYLFLNGGVKRGSSLPYLAVYGLPQGELYITYTGGWSLGNSSGELPNLQMKMLSGDAAIAYIDSEVANAKSTDVPTVSKRTYPLQDLNANYVGGKKGLFVTNMPNKGVDTGNQSSGDLVSRGAVGVAGIDEGGRLNTTGHTYRGQLIYAQLTNAASPLFAQLTGTDVAAELVKIKDAAQTIRKEHGTYYFGQDSNAKAKYDAILAMKINAGGKGDLKDLIKAAVAAGLPGVSETISTDPQYWQRAYYMDFTKPGRFGFPTRGQLGGPVTAEFFKDTVFAQ